MKNGQFFLVRLYRENGELVEFILESVDKDTVKFDLQKQYNREFRVIEDEEMTILEEIRL